MKLKALKDFFAKGELVKRGDLCDVTEGEAKGLIYHGQAEFSNPEMELADVGLTETKDEKINRTISGYNTREIKKRGTK